MVGTGRAMHCSINDTAQHTGEERAVLTWELGTQQSCNLANERGDKALQACKRHPAAPSPLEIPFCNCCKCVSSFLYKVVAAQLIPQPVLKGLCWKS